MKQFIKGTIITAICTYLFIAFCAWNIVWVIDCHTILRIFFAIWCLIGGTITETYPNKKETNN